MPLKESRYAISGKDATTGKDIILEVKEGSVDDGQARATELAAKAVGETFRVWQGVAEVTVKTVVTPFRRRSPSDETPPGSEQGQQEAGQNEGGQA